MSNPPHRIARRRFLQTAAATGAVTAYGLTVPGASHAADGGAAAAGGTAAAGDGSRAPTIVVQWDKVALQAIRNTGPGPTVEARHLAVLHTAIYDAWAAYDDTALGTRLGAALRQPAGRRSPDNRDEAISFAAYRALVDLFPQPVQRAYLSAVMRRLGYDPSDDRTTGSTPSAVGNAAAHAVLDFRHQDGSNQLGSPAYADTTGYQPVNTVDEIRDPNRWQPLRIPQSYGGSVVQTWLTPQWGYVTPFALRSPDQFLPARPPARVDEQRYRDQVDEVLRVSAGLTDRQKAISEYWAGVKIRVWPPGHLAELAQYMSTRDRHDAGQDAVMFFALTNAILDASIACWYVKRYYDAARPITEIRYLFQDRPAQAWAGPYLGAGAVLGQDWRPYQLPTFVTPPFAEFPSGHSTFSAACNEVLNRFTGSDRFGASYLEPAESSGIEGGISPARDVELRWPTLTASTQEAGLSRLYGGIHFTQAIEDGWAMGKQVGAQAWERAVRLVRGQPVD
jgi:hypothetical protein